MSFVKNNKRYLYICLALPIALGLSYIEIDPHTFGFPFNLVLCLLCVYVSVLAGRLSELFFSGEKGGRNCFYYYRYINGIALVVLSSPIVFL